MKAASSQQLSNSGAVTALLGRLRQGDQRALDLLIPLVHGELRRLARSQLRNERANHTLQTTALAHEAYLRLVALEHRDWRDRTHFFGVASGIMRRILIDHARKHGAAKRGSGATHIQIEDAEVPANERPLELIALDDALARLGVMDARQERIVELRFFAGLSVEETAAVLGTSSRTVKREWAVARAWLRAELGR
jgi:RNA polymerase sigma-70 factor, ECF subfamily